MEMTENILRELRSNGFRRSAAREAILKLLECAHSPLSAPDIERRLASGRRSFNKTTVYRELDVLRTAGYVSELTLRNDKALYELSGPHHHHLVCVGCGMVRDVDVREDPWEREERRLERKEGFRIFDHSLEFSGLCAGCR